MEEVWQVAGKVTVNAVDYGYKVTAVQEACAVQTMIFDEVEVLAKHMQQSPFATLKSHCDVIKFEVFKKKLSF